MKAFLPLAMISGLLFTAPLTSAEELYGDGIRVNFCFDTGMQPCRPDVVDGLGTCFSEAGCVGGSERASGVFEDSCFGNWQGGSWRNETNGQCIN